MHRRSAPSIFHNSPICTATIPRYTQVEEFKIVLIQLQVCMYRHGRRCNTTLIFKTNDAFSKIGRPNTWRDSRVIIGIFIFCSKFLSLYELYIRPCRELLKKKPQPGKLYQKREMQLMQKLWAPEKKMLVERLK